MAVVVINAFKEILDFLIFHYIVSFFFFFCLIMKDHLPQTITRSRGLLFTTCALGFLKRDVPCSLADILRHNCLFLLVKLLLLTCGCSSHPSFFYQLPTLPLHLKHSVRPLIPLFCLWANAGSLCVSHKCMFMAPHIEFLNLYLY